MKFLFPGIIDDIRIYFIRKLCSSTDLKKYAARLQEAVNLMTTLTPKPTLRGIHKLKSSDIRIRAETEEEAHQLSEVKWSIATD